MTAFHNIMLFSPGAPLTPAGGSSCSLLKSRMRRLRAAVVMVRLGLGPGVAYLGEMITLFSDDVNRYRSKIAFVWINL